MGPIFQTGCSKTSCKETFCNSSFDLFLNGPPEAVNNNFLMVEESLPSKHWKSALCSLSMGRICTPFSLAKVVTNSPAATNDSLLAKAIVFFCRIAAMTAGKASIPDEATMVIVTEGSVATETNPSSPKRISI
ncbi:Uncharacterised protein [Chlamydia trachomatis]|nr:Uncharacterised protein [Chlamydia trachomatis]